MRTTSISKEISRPPMMKMGGFKTGGFGGGWSKMIPGVMRTTTSTSRTSSGPPMMKMGGFGGFKMGGMTRRVVSSSSTSRQGWPTMKTGGFGMSGMIPGMMRTTSTTTRRASPVFKMTGSKATLVNAD
jgi:hypothetical protein